MTDLPLSAPPARPAIERGLVWLLLILGLAIPTVVGLLTPYVIVALTVIAFVAVLVSGRILDAYGTPASRLMLLAFMLMAGAFAVTAKAPTDMLFAFNFTMLLLYGPLEWMMRRASDTRSVAVVSGLATAGVLLTLAMVYLAVLRGAPRPGGINLGPIVLSNGVLALSVIATMGTVGLRNRWSLLLPLTIPLAVAITVMTQSRGPLIAVLPLLAFTAIFLWRVRFRGSWLFWAVTAVLGAGLAVVAYLLAHGRMTRLPKVLGSFFGGETINDRTTNIRLALYEGGWKAFQQSPWIGHGWKRLMIDVLPFIDRKYVKAAKVLPQLHNDVLNFAVSAGLVGVVAYLIIIATPFVVACLSVRDRLWPARVYATGAIAMVYIGGGITDLMFGHEYHTALYVILNAIVLGLVREPVTAPPIPGAVAA